MDGCVFESNRLMIKPKKENKTKTRHKSVKTFKDFNIPVLRLLVGFGNGILTSSVYIAESVSPEDRGSVVMVRKFKKTHLLHSYYGKNITCKVQLF